jgi:heterodisulfide reductase subunit A-like polyferredoxin
LQLTIFGRKRSFTMFETVKKFFVDHKTEVIRTALVIGGGLLGLVAAAIAVGTGESLPEEIVEPNPGEGDPYSEPSL